jgi:integrase
MHSINRLPLHSLLYSVPFKRRGPEKRCLLLTQGGQARLGSETQNGLYSNHPRTARVGSERKLTQDAVEALKGLLKRQLEEIEAARDYYQDRGLVFASHKSTTMSSSNLTARSFKPSLKRAGLPDMRLHDLRHTCVTLLLTRGVHPTFVQELLGHATISITLDTYSHLFPSMSDQTATAMEEALR